MDTLLEPIFKSHKLPDYLNTALSLYEDEKRRREAFYDWITEDSRAEFINGEVIVQSPAKNRHTVAMLNLASLLSAYVDMQECGLVLAETALVSLRRNDYLPDVCFFGNEKAAGISAEQMKYPPPDLIIKVLSPSTEKTDRTIKFDDYAEHGVWEYWLVDPQEEAVEQYLLQDGRYVLQVKLRTGEIESDIVTGFAIAVEAIFDRKRKNQALMKLFSAE